MRGWHTAVYDQANNLMMVFGGGSGYPVPSMLNDTWVLSNANGSGATPVWTQLSPTGSLPTPRGRHTAVYDPGSNRMIVFGGNRSIAFCGGELNDTWVLTNANGLGGTPSWIQLFPFGGPPGARFEHSAVYDQANNRMIVFGGGPACGAFFGDLWVLTNANGLGGTPTWTQLSPTGGSPGPEVGHTAVYDAASNVMTVFGGCGLVACLRNDAWALSNANGLGGTPSWAQLMPAGGLPPGRDHHSAVYDPPTNRMTIFGGEGVAGTGLAASVANDVWVLSNANGFGGTPAWTQIFPTGGPPGGRAVHTAVYDLAMKRMTAFGGLTSTATFCCSTLNDVWVLTNANGLSQNTPAGTNVKVTPVDTTTGTSPVTLTFSNVTQAGTTTLTTSGTGSPPPTGFKLGNPATYFQLSTTAVFSGPVTVCINYSGITFGNTSKLRLFHFEGGAWVNVTVSLDTTNKVICGGVTSLSPFAIFEFAYTATIQPPISADGSSVFNASRGAVPVKFTLALDGVPTCNLPPAMISVFRTSGGTVGPINQSVFSLPSDSGSSFRIDTINCQYVYNLGTSSFGPGSYLVQISIGDVVVGSATFGLQ